MNGKREPCRLCHSDGELRFSHILPEFLYKPLYDEKHRFIGLKPEPAPGANEDLLQKGIREYLLCADCEEQLSKFERYASQVLRELPDTSRESPGAVVCVSGIDYARFKLFQLSLLWRAGVSSQASFRGIDLGPHEERLRKMIRDGDPGEPLDYGCVLIRTRGPEKLDNLIKLPSRIRFLGHNGCQMVLAGMIWTFVVSGHLSRLHETGPFLTRNGNLPIHIGIGTASEFIARLGRALRKEGMIDD